MISNLPAARAHEKQCQIRRSAALAAIGDAHQHLFSDPDFTKEMEMALDHSQFICNAISRNPDMFLGLVRSRALWTPRSPGELAGQLARELSRSDNRHGLQETIGRIREQEMLRIAWRDINRLADLKETTADLSILAETCIEAVFSKLHARLVRRHGTPLDQRGNAQKIIVLGMGKLGAGELNFSSDIDLIFAFPEEGAMERPHRVDNCEMFFTRLCREFLKVFHTTGTGTPLFRVDTRLRPFGDTGPLVMSSDAMEIYYQTQGREWERYALIKARPVAGDLSGGHRLLDRLKPFVFRRYLDYGTFDAFRDMKQRISMQVRDKRLGNNIKLGPGGIREIEFFGQLFQLIRGGVTPQLQEKKILTVLDLLVSEALIDSTTGRQLTAAYIFLRTVEHRLQEYDDQQTHDIPREESRQVGLARSMGFDTWPPFRQALDFHMGIVHAHFSNLLVSPEPETEDDILDPFCYLWENINDPQCELETGDLAGFSAPEKVVQILKGLAEHPHTRKLTRTGRRRLNRLVPRLTRKAGGKNAAETILQRIISLVIAVERRTCYLSLLVENPAALDTLITLAAKSPWVIAFLSQHPALLDELLDPAALYTVPDSTALDADLAHRMAAIPPDDAEFQLEELCLFKQTHTLRVAVADLSNNYPLMKVSDALTHIAETVLKKVLRIAWNRVASRYGVPTGIDARATETPGFAAIAYGKLGGIELGYKSDLDLVFVHSESQGHTTGGARSIENIRFYTFLGQRIISMLTMHTPAGTLYEPDMRLRPSGQSGMIVSHIDAFQDYMEHNAWTWEHQAIIRARPVAGDPLLQNRFNRIRQEVLAARRDPRELKTEIREMRRRIKKEHFSHTAQAFDVKQGHGGIVDIEFLVQYLTLKHAWNHPKLIQWTDNIRLIDTLAGEGILTFHQAAELKNAYIVFRRAVHRRDLEETRRVISPEKFRDQIQVVSALFQNFLDTR